MGYGWILKRASHAFEGMCVYEKGVDVFASRNVNAVQFVRGVCGTNTRAYLVQVSDQRGTCLVEIPAKGGLCL